MSSFIHLFIQFFAKYFDITQRKATTRIELDEKGVKHLYSPDERNNEWMKQRLRQESATLRQFLPISTEALGEHVQYCIVCVPTKTIQGWSLDWASAGCVQQRRLSAFAVTAHFTLMRRLHCAVARVYLKKPQ